jgi:hypothetical protein
VSKKAEPRYVDGRSHNERFGAMAAVARRQFCGKFNVSTPQQVQWKPPLRQASNTLCAMLGHAQCKWQEFKKTRLKITRNLTDLKFLRWKMQSE